VDASAASISFRDRTALRDCTKACARGEQSPAGWFFVTPNNQTYLSRTYVYNGCAVAAFTNTADVLGAIKG